MSWSSRKKKRVNLCFISIYSILNKLSEYYTFTFQKIFHTLLLLAFKIVKSLQCILNMNHVSWIIRSYYDFSLHWNWNWFLRWMNIIPVYCKYSFVLDHLNNLLNAFDFALVFAKSTHPNTVFHSVKNSSIMFQSLVIQLSTSLYPPGTF